MADRDALEERDEEEERVVVEGEDEEDGEQRPQPEPEDEDHQEAGEEDEGDDRRRERREKRKLQKQKRREYQERDRHTIESLMREVRSLRERVGAAEGGVASSQKAQIDRAIGEADSTVNHLQDLKRKALADFDADAVVKIDDQLYAARRRADDLRDVKRQVESQPPRKGGIDPDVQREHQRWSSRNTWFNPQSREEDSLIARAVDNALTAEGRLHPGSAEYWNELDRRLAKRLPHRYSKQRAPEPDDYGDEEDEPDSRPTRRPPTQGSGRAAPAGSKTYVVSKARKEAMMAAGLWNVPEKRKRAIAEYKRYDAENRNR